jgi:hypothetical protein
MRNGSVLFREPSQSEGGRTFEMAFQDDNSRAADLQSKPLPPKQTGARNSPSNAGRFHRTILSEFEPSCRFASNSKFRTVHPACQIRGKHNPVVGLSMLLPELTAMAAIAAVPLRSISCTSVSRWRVEHSSAQLVRRTKKCCASYEG